MDGAHDAPGPAGRRARRAGLTALAVAAVLALGAAAATLLPPRLLPAPGTPATAPTGPGALPRTLHLAPRWTPSVTDRPISRAAYVVVAPLPLDATAGRMSPSSRVWVVGADDGALRRLPTAGPYAVDLSADGRFVAWAGDEVVDAAPRAGTLDENGDPVERLDGDVVAVLDVRTGTVRRVTVGAPDGAEFVVTGLRLDATGARLLVWGVTGARHRPRLDVPAVAVVDVATGGVRPLCGPASATDAAAAWRSPDVVAAAGCGPLHLGPWYPVPSGDAARRLAAVRVVPLPAEPAEDFFSGSVVSGFGQGGTAVTAAGTRWLLTPDAAGEPVTGVADERDRATSRDAWLVTTAGLRLGLGRLAGASALATVDATAVVSTWTARPEGTLAGPGQVVRVDLASGQVRTLSRSGSGRERAVAVAADVVAGGRFLDAAPPRTLRDPASWADAAARGRFAPVGWFAGLLAATGGVLLVVARRARRDA